MQILLWGVGLLLLALWTALAAGAHGLLQLDPTGLQDLKPLIDQVPMAAWLDTWFPGWAEALRFAVDLSQSLLQLLGGIGPVVVWVLWAIGAVLWLITFVVLSVAVAVIRRQLRASATPAPVPHAGQ
jgi:hypothetical protein